jgi:6-phosphogluconolactonase
MRPVAQITLGILASLALTPGLPGADKPAKGGEYIVYVGGNTRTKNKGISAYRFQPSTGKATFIGLVAETPYPSWITVSPNLEYLYAANENELKPERGKPNNVSAFAMDRKTGKLTFLNQATAGGQGPCHLSVDKTGKNLLVANYGSGSFEVIPIQTDGRLGTPTAFVQDEGSGADPQRQRGPHAHCILPSPDNRFVLGSDLGLDEILVWRFDPVKGTLAPNDPPFAKVPPKSGCRHFAFSPNAKFVYVVNEMGNTVTVFSYQAAKGALAELQNIPTLPKDFTGRSTSAEIVVDRAGKFLYTSNRGHDSIAIFAIDSKKGTLTLLENVPTQGKTPRNFAIDPTGQYLFAANQDTNNIVIFRVDAKTGKLTPTGQVLEDSPEPTCVLFVPAM